MALIAAWLRLSTCVWSMVWYSLSGLLVGVGYGNGEEGVLVSKMTLSLLTNSFASVVQKAAKSEVEEMTFP